MELRGPDLPVDDAFFAAVRRRHPDVDLVVLPPEPPPGEPAADVDDETVARVRALVGAFAATLVAGEPDVRLRYGAGESDVAVEARGVADGRTVDDLAAELEELGWSVDRPSGGLERLVAALDGGRVRASATERGLLVRVESADLPVGLERARELVR